MGTFLSERIVNYRCFIAGHGNRYSTLGASNNNRSTHTIDFHLSSHELLRIAIVAVLVYRVTTNIAAANGTGIIAGCNCDMGVLLSSSLTAVEGIDNITSLRLGRITNFVDAVFTKQLLATTVSKLPFAVAIPAGWNIRQRVRPTIEHMSLSFCAIYCTLSTASDGAENAIDHAVTSFLVFWRHRKGGAFRNDSA